MTKKISKNFASSIVGLLTVVCMAGPAHALSPDALPHGGTVAVGTATITTDHTTHTKTITQSSLDAVINWRSFNIGSNATVVFDQLAGSNSVTLNRVTGYNPSEIWGSLKANGTIILANGSGITFMNGSHVNVARLVATTSAISDADFIKGNKTGVYMFTPGADASAQVINDSRDMTVEEGGLVALVAPDVINNGTITATKGKIQLGAGDTFAVDLYGDGLINLQASNNVTHEEVNNHGKLKANGGEITLTAAEAKNVVDSLINTDGVIEADTIGERDGRIVLSADEVDVTGPIYARGQEWKGENGGTVMIDGKQVFLCDCTDIDTTGKVGAEPGTTGQITIQADKLSAKEHVRIRTNDNVTFRPHSKDTTIGVAGAPGTLQITSAILNDVDGKKVNGAEVESITIGSTDDTGLMRVGKFNWDERAILLNGTGDIQIEGAQVMSRHETFLADTVSGNMIIGPHGLVAADDTHGDAVILAASGGNFINHSGPNAVSASKGRWLIYSNAPNGDFFNNLDSGNTAVWNTVYTPGSKISQNGNRYVFAYRPTVQFAPDNLAKTYGTNYTSQVAADTYKVTGIEKGVKGAFLGDTNAIAFSGVPTIASAGAPAGANAGSYAIVGSGVTGLNGYSVTWVPGTLTVNPAILQVAANDVTKILGWPTPPLTFTYSGLVNGDSFSVFTGNLTTTAGPTAWLGKYVITQGTLSAGNNYTIAYTPGTLTITGSAHWNDASDRSKGRGKRGPNGTLLSISDSNVVPIGYLPNLAPAAGGNTTLADLAPKAGGNGPTGMTPLIQCNEATPCDINQ